MRKKLLFGFCALALGALTLTSCGDDKESASATSVAINVTEITTNSAKVTISLEGAAPSLCRFVDAVSLEELEAAGVDPENTAALNEYLTKNGVAVSLPYTKSVTELEAANQYLTGIVCYDASYNLAASAVKVFQTAAPENSIGDENNAGSVDDNKWN